MTQSNADGGRTCGLWPTMPGYRARGAVIAAPRAAPGQFRPSGPFHPIEE
ncbi:hypothetical protein [Nakamurella flava]|nr:hypothetical protein [Nakamurella flava]